MNRSLSAAAASVFGLLILLVSYSLFIEPNTLKETKLTLSSTKLKQKNKITILSDIHAPISSTLFNKIVNSINNNSSDIILIAGDINNHLTDKKPSVEFINKLSNQVNKPIFIILGDSDICSKNGQCIYCQSKYNIPNVEIKAEILRDSTINPFDKVFISGMDFTKEHYWKPPNFNESIADSNYKILLTHNTVNLEESYLSNFDFSISGNTHGGQVILAGKFLSYFDQDLDSRFLKGLYNIGKSKLFVSSGIGTSFLPIRFCVPPEIIHISLQGTSDEK